MLTILKYLRDLVKLKGVSTVARKKATVLYVDLEESVTNLWRYDEYCD
jgi:hypothetical protein